MTGLTWAVQNKIHKDVVGFFKLLVRKTYTTLIQNLQAVRLQHHVVGRL